MSDPTRAPVGWYEDGSGGRRYWDGDAWTDLRAPGPESMPPTQVSPEPSTTAVPAPEPAADGPTIPFVWGSRGAGRPDAAGPGDHAGATGSAERHDPSGQHSAAAAVNRDAPTEDYGAATTMVLPRHPLTEPALTEPSFPERSRRDLNAVGVIALGVAIVGLVFAFIPALSGYAWMLVPVAFVLSIIGLSVRGAKWPAVVALVTSVIAVVVGVVMFVAFVVASIGTAFDELDEAIPDIPAIPVPGLEDPAADPAPERSEAGTDADAAAALAFGETMTWDDGVALTVSAPEPYTPSDLAVGATRANHVVFTLTLTNGSAEALQPLPLPTLSAGDQDVRRIVDLGDDLLGTADDVGFPPTAVIEPGESITWRVAWSVDDPGSLTVDAAPHPLYPSATFTNAP
ncbi:DUF2510 domain-containing protein [Agromyces arachidis]|uniref:DUF2510 domain-containing protein n=1 Tax=Agromyces arachidis TaxID=766966 RepID=UPI004055D910